MKNGVIVFIVFCTFINLNSCRRHCNLKDYTIVNVNPLVNQYFSNYKLDNYWVFSNNKGKKDTLFVINNRTDTIPDNFDCYFMETKSIKIATNYWQSDPIVLYERGDNNGGLLTLGNSFNKGYSLSVNIDLKVFNNDFVDLDHQSTSLPIMDTLTVNNQTFKNVLIINKNEVSYSYTKFFVAPSIGIVRWENEMDTFNLINYKIK